MLIPNNTENTVSKKKSYHTLVFNFNDRNKWNKVLLYVNTEINNSVKKTLIDRFYANFNSLKQLRNFEIEDINNRIDNLIQDYDMKTKSRIAFLEEQALIARKLKLKKNTIESQFFSSKNSIIANVRTEDAPFYLRGYEAIEEEIRLMIARKEKKNFIPDILFLETKKMKLERNRMLERAEKLFLLTPILGDNFKSVLFKVASTKYIMKNNVKLYYLLSIIFGSLFGIGYVFIFSAFKQRKS